MQARSTQVLYAYWNDLRGTRTAPRRLEIEPARIGDVLHETFILERAAPHQYHYRLAGTRVCEMFGNELRGTSFLEGWDADDRSQITHAIGSALSLGAVIVLEFEASTADHQRSAWFEAVLLPLYHLQPEANRLIGTISCLKVQSWREGDRLVAKRLAKLDTIWPDGRPRVALDPLNRQAPFLPEIRHARLVRSDRRQFRVYDGGRSTDSPTKL